MVIFFCVQYLYILFLIMEHDIYEVYESLRDTLLPDATARAEAEAKVVARAAFPGYGSCLTRIILEQNGAIEVRQLAAVLLRQFICAKWNENAEGFTEPGPSSAEKASIRAVLVEGLSDRTSRMRTAVSAVIASIAQFDWPDAWPTLMDELIVPLGKAIRDPSVDDGSADAVAGVLRCMEMCASDLEEEQLLPALRLLLPLLMSVLAQKDTRTPRERSRAMRVACKLLDRLSMLCDDQDASILQLQKGELSGLALSAIAQLDASDAPTAGCWLQIELLRLLRQLITSFPRSLTPHKKQLLPCVGKLLVYLSQVHSNAIRHPVTREPAAYDSDGGLVGSDSLTTLVFDILTAVASSSRLYKLLLPSLSELFYWALTFLDITPESEATWQVDLSQYLQASPSQDPSPARSVWPHRSPRVRTSVCGSG